MVAVRKLEADEGLMTVEEWASLPESDAKYELDEGTLWRIPNVSIWHELLVARLLRFLGVYVEGRGLGWVLGSDTCIMVDEHRGIKPDVTFVSRERFHILRENLMVGPPDLVVEIPSRGHIKRDRQWRFSDLAALGVPEYWIVDYPRRRIEVYRLREEPEGRRWYERVATAAGEEVFRPDRFPGLEIPLGDLWPPQLPK